MDVIKFPVNLQTTIDLLILLHGVISLLDATSYDKVGISTEMYSKANFLYCLTKKMNWKNIICVLIHLVRFGASSLIGMVFQDMFLILKIVLRIQIEHVMSKM